MVELRVTYKTLKNSNEVVGNLKSLVDNMPKIKGISIKVGTRDGSLGQGLIQVDYDTEDEEKNEFLFAESLYKIIKYLQRKRELKIIEMLVRYLEPNKESDTFLNQFCYEDIGKEDNEGYLKIKNYETI